MAWQTLPEALAACRRLDDLGLAFIEDPFPPDRWRLDGRARRAAADARSRPARTRRARRARATWPTAVGVLRVDATTSGGFGGVLAAAAVAAARGRAVMTHAFPDLHGHLAGAAAGREVEMIPDDAGANPVGRLLARRQRVEARRARRSPTSRATGRRSTGRPSRARARAS